MQQVLREVGDEEEDELERSVQQQNLVRWKESGSSLFAWTQLNNCSRWMMMRNAASYESKKRENILCESPSLSSLLNSFEYKWKGSKEAAAATHPSTHSYHLVPPSLTLFSLQDALLWIWRVGKFRQHQDLFRQRKAASKIMERRRERVNEDFATSWSREEWTRGQVQLSRLKSCECL